ncbi:CDP-glucose 4,6-dehydratase [Niastella yeongjuensis]|uniref:CDP-glucose 4,6-dehydratase n=1 Tax=Niastella yeongjuensis TaxID=354355 RepID=A0A1V9EXH2_9BACT|nr:CDP-glucose 4,6-dehydratase [Niastella yeongjuensis]OQP50811.1 CDP-glucose 4,6-dehydratase [Niastella yeongjuensis]SEN16502.1 CDP-glucose 4,6-dehydratase [Niastella yeongjuensis]
MLLSNSYKGKKVFLTGHTGFKGSWLLTWLHLLGAQIKGYSLAPLLSQQLYSSIKGDELCDSVIANILDAEKLEKEIIDFEPDIIFHLAAQPLVRYSYEEPLDTFNVNAIGTANVLNAVRKLEKPCQVVAITTDKVYYNTESDYAYKETDRLGGYDPYSASKAAAEIIIDSYRNSFFNSKDVAQHSKSIAVARAGNVIGGGDWAKDRIIPDIIRALQNQEPVQVRNPKAIRPWQHVIEPLFGYLLLASKMANDPVQYAGAYNFGPVSDDCWEVQKVVNKAIEVWGGGKFQTPLGDYKAVHEAGILKLDIDKARQQLNWQPVFNAGEAIEKAVLWYKNFTGPNALDLMQKDITHYEQQLLTTQPA